MKKIFYFISIIFLVALVVTIYLVSSKSTSKNNGLKIAATIFPVYDIARNIVGDKIQVVQVVPPGASPHTFEVTPQTALELQGVKAIFKIGNGLDDWIDGAAQSGSPDAPIFMLSNRINLREFSDGSVDPHYWLDLNNAQIIARNIFEDILKIDPTNKDYYQKNLDEYLNELQIADKKISTTLADVSQKNIATFHDAWYYFAQRYGLNVITAFEPFPGKEPTPQYLSGFINDIKKYNLKVVFIEPQFSAQSLYQIAKDQGVNLVLINPADGGASGNDDLISLLENDAQIMASVLK
jgi:zinc transport system substrate-binding protein